MSHTGGQTAATTSISQRCWSLLRDFPTKHIWIEPCQVPVYGIFVRLLKGSYDISCMLAAELYSILIGLLFIGKNLCMPPFAPRFLQLWSSASQPPWNILLYADMAKTAQRCKHGDGRSHTTAAAFAFSGKVTCPYLIGNFYLEAMWPVCRLQERVEASPLAALCLYARWQEVLGRLCRHMATSDKAEDTLMLWHKARLLCQSC